MSPGVSFGDLRDEELGVEELLGLRTRGELRGGSNQKKL